MSSEEGRNCKIAEEKNLLSYRNVSSVVGERGATA